MKTITHIIPALALIAYGANASAADWLLDPYIHVEAGGSLVQDVKIKNTGGTEASFEPGAAATLSLGTHIGKDLAVEVQGGTIWNAIDKVGVTSLDSTKSRADLYQVPMLLNLIYKMPTNCRFSPYVGAGAGGMASILGITTPVGDFRDTDYTFAYDAFTGIQYKISDRAHMDVGYKLFGTLDHDWTDRGVNLQTEGILTHTFLLSFTWNF